MVRPSGLGKGLGALIPTGVTGDSRMGNPSGIQSATEAATNVGERSPGGAPESDQDRLIEIPISLIIPSRFQTRELFDETSLEELAASIAEVGVLQPVLVRSQTGGTYELVAGERRWRAARRVGLEVIPAIVRDTTDQQSVLQVLIENVQREDLDALEEAAGYQQLISELNLSHEEVARMAGRKRSTVSNSLRLLQLTPSIQKLIKTKELSAGHARALLQVSDRSYQETLARKAVMEGMSVRALEAAVQLRADLAAGKSGKTPSGPGKPAPQKDKPAGLLELEEILGAHFNTRVAIDFGAKNGRIGIDFADLEDLERIFSIITGESSG